MPLFSSYSYLNLNDIKYTIRKQNGTSQITDPTCLNRKEKKHTETKDSHLFYDSLQK